MATVLDTLITRLTLDGSGFQRGLRDAESKASAFGSRVGSSLKSKLAGAFSTVAVTAFARSIIDTASNIKDLADRLDVSTDTLQRMEAGGRMVGVSMQGIETAMTKMLDGMRDGTKDAVRGLDLLGMSLEDVQAMSFDEAVNAIGQKLTSMADSGAQAEAALALFGNKGGLKALQVMKEMQSVKPTQFFSKEQLDLLDRVGDELSNVFRMAQVGAASAFEKLLVHPSQFIGAMLGSGGDIDAAMKALSELRAPKGTTKSPIGSNTTGDDYDKRIDAANEWMAIQDEILKLEEQTAKNFEDVRVSQLTEEERRNELLTKRADLLRDINALSDVDAARNLNAVSEIDKELAQKTGRGERSGNELFFRRQSDWLTSIGGFTGAGGGQQNQTSQMLSTLQQILNTLESRGIRLRGKF